MGEEANETALQGEKSHKGKGKDSPRKYRDGGETEPPVISRQGHQLQGTEFTSENYKLVVT